MFTLLLLLVASLLSGDWVMLFDQGICWCGGEDGGWLGHCEMRKVLGLKIEWIVEGIIV